jgi:hypothetical protein
MRFALLAKATRFWIRNVVKCFRDVITTSVRIVVLETQWEGRVGGGLVHQKLVGCSSEIIRSVA